ncbi:MAG: response regulator [Gemmatimonadota bacterium]
MASTREGPEARGSEDGRKDEPVIVLAEDHEETRYVLRAVLEQGGYTVAATSNGREALDAVARTEPALVITDLMMPVLDGVQLARALTDEGGERAVPVILVSAHATDMDDESGVEAWFDAVLRKPVRPSDLLAAVHSLLTRI